MSMTLATALSLGALAGCGGSSEKKSSPKPSSSSSTPKVDVPSGVTLTKAGTKLDLGEPGVVAYAANPKKKSVLSLTVDSVQQSTMADFAAYPLDQAAAASTPYYVRATVANLGDGDLGGTGVPLLALDAQNTLVQASSFTNVFKPCPSQQLPAGFAKGATLKTCLVYLLPDHGTLQGVSYRPSQSFEPIEWSGTVQPPKKKGAKKARPGAKKKAGS